MENFTKIGGSNIKNYLKKSRQFGVTLIDTNNFKNIKLDLETKQEKIQAYFVKKRLTTKR